MKEKLPAVLFAILVIGVSVAVSRLASPPAPEPAPAPVVETPEPAPVDIDAPRTVVVGELIKFVAKGELVEWQCFPFTADCVAYGPNEQNFAVSFRRPGTYLLVFAVYVDGKLEIRNVDIHVTGDTTKPVVNSLAGDVVNWCKESSVDKALAKKLSVNFNQVASEINQGNLKTPESIIERTLEINSDLALNSMEDVMSKIQDRMTDSSNAGKLQTPPQHARMWSDISSGFKIYANSK
jgi:hypothetical protein